MKIAAEIYANIDSKALLKLICDKPELAGLIKTETSNMKAGTYGRNCPALCCRDCAGCSRVDETAYLSTALISIFEYYIPEDIKNAIHMSGSSYVDE